jgi:hypothetical protein
VWEGLLQAAAEAADDYLSEGDPGRRYLGLLVSALNSTRAYLADSQTGDVPDGMEAACGWHLEQKYQGSDSGIVPVWVPGPNTPRIGWTGGDLVYLDPDSAYTAASRILQAQGDSLPSKNEIHMDLFHSGKLARTDARNKKEGRGRYTARVSLEKKQQSVLVIRAVDFWGDDQSEAGT